MDGELTLDPTAFPNCTGEVGAPYMKCNQEFTHQVKLMPVDGNKVSLKGIPYQFIFKSKNTHGKTTRTGETERINTFKPEAVTALAGKLAEGYRRRGGNFGSLKEVAERKINLVTDEGYPQKAVPYCSGYDYITIVAARTAPRDWRWQGGFGLTEEGEGNQYRFINCGLRQLREFPAASQGDSSVQRIMVVFQQGYNQEDINKINEYTKYLNSRIVYVRNKDELIDFLNQRKTKKRLIKKLVIFCHGIINIASFHYAGDNVKAGEFGLKDIEKVHESIFDYDAEVTTYACRAGISVDEDDLTGKDAGQKHSPAQKMADTWDVKVRAFEMRSSYVGIYGNDKEIELAKGYQEVINNHLNNMKKYEKEVSRGNKEARPPKKPENYEENVMRHKDVNQREWNDKKGGPISPNGSWRLPTTGSTPSGLKKGLQEYLPIEWRM